MQIAPMGFVVFAAIFVAGYYARSPLIVGLLASMAFGTTSLMTVGGSSPLLYAYFGALLLTVVAARRSIWRDLGYVLGSMRPIWVLCCLMVYAVLGSLLFPRLFAGQTTVFVVPEGSLGITETMLAPTSGNITQPAYFALGGLIAIALSILLLRKGRMEQVRLGFLFWCGLHTGMGLLDLMSKLAGAGDVLAPIRTANYAMLTNINEGGFVRIAGAQAEASAFASASLACLAFLYVYWRKTKERVALWLTLTLLCLLLLCTSSTGYAGLMMLSAGVSVSMAWATLRNRIQTNDVLIVASLAVAVFIVLATVLFNEKFFDPVLDLIDRTILSKGSSGSAQERTYWNMKSLQAFVDTGGFGIGFGSSRASSWLIAVLSQLGVIGSVMMAVLVVVVLRGLGGLRRYVDPATDALVSSVRAGAFGSLVAGSLVSGTADPGLVFFTAFAVVAVSRVHAHANKREMLARAAQGAALANELLDDRSPGAQLDKASATPVLRPLRS